MSSPPSTAASSVSAPSVTSLAYLKMVLHAVRYPARPVMGVLLGSASGVCQNCVPAFHSNPLAPALEISFLMIEELARKRGQQIIGIYAANESDQDGYELTLWPKIVAEKVGEQLGDSMAPTVFMIRNDRLAENEMALKAYSLHSGHFSDAADPKIVAYGSNASSSSSSSSSATGDAQHATLAALLEAIRLRSESILVDFEQHLQAATDDWTNEALDTELIALIAKKSAQ